MKKYLDFRKKINYEELKEVAKIIKNGGVVVFPTDTVYGIGTNGLNEEAIKKLYEIKNRKLNKPICLLVSDMEMINKLAIDITKTELKLMKTFFPGPFTIILKKNKIIPNILTANTDTVGIRIPDSEITRKLIEYAGVPIATSSANISGNRSGTNLKNVFEELGNKVDYYIDEGESKIGISSTIVRVDSESPKILRQGSITEQEILNVLNNFEK